MSGRSKHSRGFSLIELLVVIAIIMIIVAIAVPSLMHSRRSANEASAVGSLHTLNTACQSYATTYGTGFPAALSNLAPAANASAEAADLIDSVLAAGIKSGYTFTYTPATAVNGTINAYTINADPIVRGTTGERGFYTDQTLVIRENANSSASSADSPLQ